MLRVWEPARHFVVVGYANQVEREVNVPFCRQSGLPILRRCSGGGTVLQGPGCLNYALSLRLDAAGPLHSVTSTNRLVLNRHRALLQELLQRPVQAQGQTDLALGALKFSGNSQRRRRRALLFHGTFLLDFDVALIEQALLMPSRQPDYRANRSHSQFLVNLGIPASHLKAALRQGWQAQAALADVPLDRIRLLAQDRYAKPEWTWAERLKAELKAKG